MAERVIKNVKEEMFLYVLNELKKCDLFVGKYDAKNGNEHFMNGVACVMESIAYRAGEDIGDEFSDEFTRNLIASEDLV